MKRISKTVAIILFFFLVCTMFIGECFADNEASLDVNFDVLTGSGRSDYYVGDYFWYNITLKNSGSYDINGTFKIEVLNSTGGVIYAINNFQIALKQNDTYFLFPNYTRNGREEHSIYYFETTGTYSIVLSSNVILQYYRRYAPDLYTYSPNECRYSFDVMPSYQKIQNDMWNDFLAKNTDYMNQVENSIQQSRIESQKTTNLTYFTIMIAVFSVFLAIGSFYVSWWQLNKEKQQKYRWFFGLFITCCALFLLLIAFVFWSVLSQN
jgi:hypothetical protein